MFGIGETELVIIVVFAFLLFGPDKLPGMGRTLGRVLRQFREASDGFSEVVQTNIMDPASEELEKSPKQRKREEAERLAEESGEAAPANSAEQGEPAPKRETFAERRARLMAERKAAEEASAAAEQASAATEQAGVAGEQVSVASEPEVAGEPAQAAEPTPAPEDEPEPVRTSAADLYAMTGAKSTRAQAREAKQADEASREEDGSTEA